MSEHEKKITDVETVKAVLERAEWIEKKINAAYSKVNEIYTSAKSRKESADMNTVFDTVFYYAFMIVTFITVTVLYYGFITAISSDLAALVISVAAMLFTWLAFVGLITLIVALRKKTA